VNSLGVATGNLSIVIFLLALIVAPLAYWLRRTGEVESKPEYEIDEIKSASDALSVVLMRIRDGKDKGINPDGVLVKLTREMQQLVRIEGESSRLAQIEGQSSRFAQIDGQSSRFAQIEGESSRFAQIELNDIDIDEIHDFNSDVLIMDENVHRDAIHPITLSRTRTTLDVFKDDYSTVIDNDGKYDVHSDVRMMREGGRDVIPQMTLSRKKNHLEVFNV